MTIFKRARALWRSLRSKRKTTHLGGEKARGGEAHLELARESLRDLLSDNRIPRTVRAALEEDYAAVGRLLDKLEHGHVHIAVLGRVGVGKSSLLNALLGLEHFRTSALHGETRQSEYARWTEFDAGGVYLIDTPGIDEIGGEERETLARETAARADLVLFVVDGDLANVEFESLSALTQAGRPTVVVLNKADRFTSAQREQLLQAIRVRTQELVEGRNIVAASAQPSARTYLVIDERGGESEHVRALPVDVEDLKARLWEILESEGKTLAALNATLFASDLSDQVARRIVETRRELAERVVRTYCISKGVVVALNPVPVADLFAAAFVDVGMVFHLSRVHGLPLTRAEAGSLITTIVTQLATLMGAVWAVHFASAALKLGSGGLSTLVTASTQGAVAYYSTYVVGQVAERYLANGKSWGEAGPKPVVEEILGDLDRDSILAQARDDIRSRLRSG